MGEIELIQLPSGKPYELNPPSPRLYKKALELVKAGVPLSAADQYSMVYAQVYLALKTYDGKYPGDLGVPLAQASGDLSGASIAMGFAEAIGDEDFAALSWHLLGLDVRAPDLAAQIVADVMARQAPTEAPAGDPNAPTGDGPSPTPT